MTVLSIDKEDDIYIVKFNTDVIAGNIHIIKEKINEFLSQNVVKLVFDFKSVNFMDSSGIGFLVTVLKELSKKNSKLKLCNLNTTVSSTLKQVQLYSFFEIFDSVDEAVESFY
jgi:anti-anti-sigma factor